VTSSTILLTMVMGDDTKNLLNTDLARVADLWVRKVSAAEGSVKPTTNPILTKVARGQISRYVAKDISKGAAAFARVP